MLAQQLCCCCSWGSALSCVSSSTTQLERPLRWCLISKLRLEMLPIPPFISWNSRIKLFRGINDDFWPDMLDSPPHSAKPPSWNCPELFPLSTRGAAKPCKVPAEYTVWNEEIPLNKLWEQQFNLYWRNSLLYPQEILIALILKICNASTQVDSFPL